jgi:hypothetical protein
MEELREQWFELEAVFRRTGDAAPLNNIIEEIRA